MKKLYISSFLFFLSSYALDEFQQAEKLYRSTKKKIEKEECHLDDLVGTSPKGLCMLAQQMMLSRSFTKQAYLIHGPTGVGKTAAVKAVVKQVLNHSKSKVKIISITSEQDLQQQRAAIDKSAQNSFVILFLDGLDTMPENERNELLHKALVRAKENHDVGHVIMIATMSDAKRVPEPLRRQCVEIKLDLPDKKECETLFEAVLGDAGTPLKKQVSGFARRAVSNKCSRRDIIQIIERAHVISQSANLPFLVKGSVDDAFDQVIEERKEQEKLIKSAKKEEIDVQQWLLTIAAAAIPPVLTYALSRFNFPPCADDQAVLHG